jgi:16S rRNA (cytosine967-C5)-methyltransferase
MKKSSLFGHAAEALTGIRDGRRPADAVLGDFFRERRYLGARDRREISSMVFGVLRNSRFLQCLVDASAARTLNLPDVNQASNSALLLAAWVLHVAGDTSEESRDALDQLFSLPHLAVVPKDLVAFLPNATIPSELLAPPESRIATVYSFPDVVIREWLARFGQEDTELLAKSLNQQAPLGIRVNTLKTTVDACRKTLEAASVQTEKGSCSPFALVLTKRLSLESLAPYKDGLFEMQDEGSQILSLLVDPQPGTTVIDACAGGGGKTLHCAALMQNRGRLVAIDVDTRKLENLRQRAERAGATVNAVLHAERDAQAIAKLHGKAQAVLVDAPCSAIGTVRRNPTLKMTYTEKRSEELSAVQQSLLESASALVAPGGRLVYSTCTLMKRENEDVAEDFTLRHPEFTLQSAGEILTRWGLTIDRTSPYLHLYPHKNGTDGFFAAVFVREP